MFILNKNSFMIVNIKNIIHNLIIALIALTPIFSIQESLALIFGGIIDNSTALTPVYIKAIKDFGFFLIILAGFIGILKLKNINKTAFLVFMYVVLVIIFGFFYKNNLLIFLSGLRWIVPIILIIFLIQYIHKNLIERIAKLLTYLFIFHFIFQIIQLFFAEGWFGLNAFGLSARNPGMFFIPSTSAFFAVLVLFFSMFYLNIEWLKKVIFVLAPVSIFLTSSGSGVVSYIVVLSIYLMKKQYVILLPLLGFFLFFIVIATVEDLTGRPGLIEESFGTRVKIFIDIFVNSTFFSQNLGYGTSAGYLLANEYGLSFDMIATDSTYASILVNLGLLSFILIIGILFIVLVLAWLNQSKQILIYVVIFVLFSATTIILEAYPMNLLFAILTAYYLKNYRKENI